MELTVTNVNQALSELLQYLRVSGREENSRNGAVLVAPEPVLITYTRPTERVLFSPLRDANPWFHLFESLHMLAGRSDIAFLTYFNKRMADYSDDGKTQWGAYGRRWRGWFGYDQLKVIIQELRERPDSRRCVLQMWDAMNLLEGSQNGVDGKLPDIVIAARGGKDVPCNTQAYFDLRGGALNMTVMNRSNDLIWGLAGANAVHFSFLLSYMSAHLAVPVGVYRQFTNNLHAYPANLPKESTLAALSIDASSHDYYLQGKVTPLPLINTSIDTWDEDLALFFRNLDNNPIAPKFKDMFFTSTVWPMYRSWRTRKEKEGDGLTWVEKIVADDWRLACTDWIERRAAKKAQSA